MGIAAARPQPAVWGDSRTADDLKSAGVKPQRISSYSYLSAGRESTDRATSSANPQLALDRLPQVATGTGLHGCHRGEIGRKGHAPEARLIVAILSACTVQRSHTVQPAGPFALDTTKLGAPQALDSDRAAAAWIQAKDCPRGLRPASTHQLGQAYNLPVADPEAGISQFACGA